MTPMNSGLLAAMIWGFTRADRAKIKAGTLKTGDLSLSTDTPNITQNDIDNLFAVSACFTNSVKNTNPAQGVEEAIDKEMKNFLGDLRALEMDLGCKRLITADDAYALVQLLYRSYIIAGMAGARWGKDSGLTDRQANKVGGTAFQY